jgi:hypothetical protein
MVKNVAIWLKLFFICWRRLHLFCWQFFSSNYEWQPCHFSAKTFIESITCNQIFFIALSRTKLKPYTKSTSIKFIICQKVQVSLAAKSVLRLTASLNLQLDEVFPQNTSFYFPADQNGHARWGPLGLYFQVDLVASAGVGARGPSSLFGASTGSWMTAVCRTKRS